MIDPLHLLKIFFAAAFVNNYVLMKFLGVGMSFAVLFVMTLASVGSWVSFHFVLKPGPYNIIQQVTGKAIDLTFLQTVVFILIIAVLVQLTEMFLKKANPTLYEALGVYLPLITTNCAILGVALINIQADYDLMECIAESFGAAFGFGIALVMMGGIRERLEVTHVPRAFQGPPIAFCTAALMALSFMGFSGML
jgi:Na+-translocating ferredoxin:NAD+ oxidoreductase subunit A